MKIKKGETYYLLTIYKSGIPDAIYEKTAYENETFKNTREFKHYKTLNKAKAAYKLLKHKYQKQIPSKVKQLQKLAKKLGYKLVRR